MDSTAPTEGRSRERLTRDRVLKAALARSDTVGLDALSMRGLAELLGVAPMALYRHVTDKDDLIDAMVDAVFAEIGVPSGGGDWQDSMRRRGIAIRDALMRHRWAIGLMESRRHPGPANLRHHDAVLGRLRAAGFTIPMATHAYALLDAYIYGFALTRLNLPFQSAEEVADVATAMLQPFAANEFPNLVEFISEHAMRPGYDHGAEFEYGLHLILGGLERARQSP